MDVCLTQEFKDELTERIEKAAKGLHGDHIIYFRDNTKAWLDIEGYSALNIVYVWKQSEKDHFVFSLEVFSQHTRRGTKDFATPQERAAKREEEEKKKEEEEEIQEILDEAANEAMKYSLKAAYIRDILED